MDTIDPAVLAREVTLSPGRRRRSYSAEEKLRIVQEMLKPLKQLDLRDLKVQLFTGATELPASQPGELDLQPLDLQLLCLNARTML